MSNDNVLELRKLEVSNEVRDLLSDVLRDGARTLLAQAVEAEVAEFLARHEGEQDAAGRKRMVRTNRGAVNQARRAQIIANMECNTVQVQILDSAVLHSGYDV